MTTLLIQMQFSRLAFTKKYSIINFRNNKKQQDKSAVFILL